MTQALRYKVPTCTQTPPAKHVTECLFSVSVHTLCLPEGCWEHIWFWAWKLLHPRALPYRLKQFRWVVLLLILCMPKPNNRLCHCWQRELGSESFTSLSLFFDLPHHAFLYVLHPQKSHWEEVLPCLSLWTQTSRWQYFSKLNKQIAVGLSLLTRRG